ncbi:hypothetical protein [Phenylobacterium kunshanense]|uniref:Uncharacterized protein n=1 Tax=Phenylobacterium kunshanense TaxID=1445034 RepID=A0A328B7S0_9CAUL|nr:hypothetical protein [Phenylobacterium kunshanense]RAK62461.1 hypothetical protein DJ019_18735 [Phenylobacterium kunshanense]
MMAKVASKPTGSPDSRFRSQIEAAIAEGIAPEDMTLRLTLRDVTLLSRDRSTPVADISYAGGEMRFLGVRVEKGGVDVSSLVRGEA